MNLYFVSRWGNPVEGPNGADTNYLVQAETPEQGEELANENLKWIPSSFYPPGPRAPGADPKNTSSICQSVLLLGVSSESDKACIVHGPWVGHAYVRGSYGKHYPKIIG
jgi:hypothetical protein